MKTKKITAIIVISVLILILISSFVLAAKTTITFDNKGLNIYKYPDGRTAILSEVTSVDLENDNIVYTLPNGKLTLNLDVVYEGKKSKIKNFKNEKGINFELKKQKYDYWKYGLEFSNLKNIKSQDINSIELNYDLQGYNINDLKFEDASILFPDDIRLSFNDISKDLRVLVTPTKIIIHGFNVANQTKFNDLDLLYLDPTITIRTPDNEVLDDAFTNTAFPDQNSGSSINVEIGGLNNYTQWVKFNISMIPGNSVIDYAEYYVICGVDSGNQDNAATMEVYNSTNITWTEETITSNNKPSYGTLQNSTKSWSNGITTRFNVTEAVKSAYSSEEKLSLAVYTTGIHGNNNHCTNGKSKENSDQYNRHGLNITYSDAPVDLTSNVILYVNNVAVFNNSGSFNTTKTTNDFAQEINNFIENCIADAEGYCNIPLSLHSDSAGNINISNIDVNFNANSYSWVTTNLSELSTYKVRVRATDGSLNSSYDQSDNDFTISHIVANDTNKFIFQNNAGTNVAWFGDQGNIVLKGTCSLSANCQPPTDSFIFKDSNNNIVSHIDSNGNLCIESGDCSDGSANCNPSINAFIIQNSTNSNMSYIDFTGNLCLTGTLTQNGNP